MENISRFCLCYFSYDVSSQDKDAYSQNQALINECMRRCRESLASLPYEAPPVIAHVQYDVKLKNLKDVRRISFIGYKGHVFCGLYKNGTISFKDEENQFQIFDGDRQLAKLESLFKSACRAASQNRYYAIKEIAEAWRQTIPLLDAVIEYERQLKKLKEKDYNRIKHSLDYDKTIDYLVHEYEAGNMIPQNPQMPKIGVLDQRLAWAETTLHNNKAQPPQKPNMPKR